MESALVATILDGVPLPCVLIGPDERIRAANAAARNLLGAGILGRHHLMAMRQPALLEVVEGALRHGQAGQARVALGSPAGESVFRISVTPVAGEGQRGVLCTFEDVTEAEKIGRMRRDFVANVSHELRTPLTALLGFIETLQGPARDDAAARARFLGIMAREAQRMNRLVRDLLHLSRVEAEERVRPRDAVALKPLLEGVIASLRDGAGKTGDSVVLAGDAATVPGDHDQLVQVFTNLIENALKYGRPGQVVRVTLSPEDTLRGLAICVEVADQGEGIDPIHLPRLTERFYRVDSHRSREMGGTGLGLAIVKHIVSRHRGWLRVESVVGEGSRFSVVLPLG